MNTCIFQRYKIHENKRQTMYTVDLCSKCLMWMLLTQLDLPEAHTQFVSRQTSQEGIKLEFHIHYTLLI